MKTVAVFGSTGSIGVQTLSVVRRFPKDYKIIALTAGNNVTLLKEQIREFSPDYVGANEKFSSGAKYEYFSDLSSLANDCDADIYVVAISGISALPPLINIIKKGKRIALANKEAIVCAGDLIMNMASQYGSEIIPVDSEHSAVFQCLMLGNKDVSRIILTASGGPFFSSDINLHDITPEQALKHPTWNMGKKISIDSATMVNKGLEIIEARRLFGEKQVDYIIHPESVIHSMVEYDDGSTVALMSYPNMTLAIQYALTYPDRIDNPFVKSFDFKKPLTFFEPDEKRFPAPRIAKQCLDIGGNAPAIYSMADEVAVELFLSNKIKFTDICGIIEEALSINEIETNFDYEYLLALNKNITNYFRRKYS